MVVIHGAIRVELNADETSDRRFEGEGLGIDDVDTEVGTIGEVVLGAFRIDPADVERPERTTGHYRDCLAELSLNCGRWTLCACGHRGANQQCRKPRCASQCRAR